MSRHAKLEIARQQTVKPGEFYTLLPPLDDIHYVKTVSDTPSVSIHLLANDTACVTRHRFDATSGIVTPFRSGYSNAKCADRVALCAAAGAKDRGTGVCRGEGRSRERSTEPTQVTGRQIERRPGR